MRDGINTCLPSAFTAHLMPSAEETTISILPFGARSLMSFAVAVAAMPMAASKAIENLAFMM